VGSSVSRTNGYRSVGSRLRDPGGFQPGFRMRLTTESAAEVDVGSASTNYLTCRLSPNTDPRSSMSSPARPWLSSVASGRPILRALNQQCTPRSLRAWPRNRHPACESDSARPAGGWLFGDESRPLWFAVRLIGAPNRRVPLGAGRFFKGTAVHPRWCCFVAHRWFPVDGHPCPEHLRASVLACQHRPCSGGFLSPGAARRAQAAAWAGVCRRL